VVERARIVLLAADEVPGKEIAAIVGCAEGTVVTWRGRYAEHGQAGLEGLPRTAVPRTSCDRRSPKPGRSNSRLAEPTPRRALRRPCGWGAQAANLDHAM
jgi:Homeodomain-like domain